MPFPSPPSSLSSVTSAAPAAQELASPQNHALRRKESLQPSYFLVEPPSNYHYNNARATSPVLVERAVVRPSPEVEKEDVRRRVEDYCHEQVRERDLAVIMTPAEPEPCGRFGFHRESYGYYFPSACSFSDVPGSGNAESPYYVNTPPPGAKEELSAADRGPFYAEVVRERTVHTARRRVKAKFLEYFRILD
ncbi:hypothetical protein PGTUg99_032198 [Puccinia graminis f. sp. tritici]|uniref:Uncharacterized protein n=1 Tax=Puccinia graminis f. sp. tritici TaxID=56615 RepID=A0A5B0SHZ1_PUCGR|nr:hypothetical protein PGTUg99_032198 [Puccinia graminis f. sp. tritici]